MNVTVIITVHGRNSAWLCAQRSRDLQIPEKKSRIRSNAWKQRTVKVRSHLATTSTFACAFASNFNIVSMVMLTFMQRMNTEPILCVCLLLPLLPLFSKMQVQTLTLSVNLPKQLGLEVTES